MKRRPLERRFNEAVLSGRKFTTIRRKPWPVGEDIMLYNWCGVPYRKGSTQVSVACIRVMEVGEIVIGQLEDRSMVYGSDLMKGHKNDADGELTQIFLMEGKPLYEVEGFPSGLSMDEWFRKVVKVGEAVRQSHMRFQLRPLPIPNS